MAGAQTGASDVADASLNVVPFIDLLVCLICFLVVSAVWTSLTRIDVDQALPKTGAKAAEPPKPKPTIQVAVTGQGFAVNVHGGEPALAAPVRIAPLGTVQLCRGDEGAGGCQGEVERYARHDRERLREVLAGLMAKAGPAPKVMVAAGDDVPYLHVIATLDDVLRTCVGEGADQRCLAEPTIADLNLVRRRGLTP